MATVNKGAQRAKAAAKEVASEACEIVWDSPAGSVTFDGPAVLPPTFAFDLAQMQSSPAEIGAVYSLIASVIGDDSMPVVRERLAAAESQDGGASELGDLLTAIVESYGADQGE